MQEEQHVTTQVLIDLITKLGFNTLAILVLITLIHHIQDTSDCKTHHYFKNP